MHTVHIYNRNSFAPRERDPDRGAAGERRRRSSASLQGKDILLTMSVEEARVRLERARQEVASKHKEMQTMVGTRYHDLIDSADSIISMHESTFAITKILEEIPEQAKALKQNIPATSDDGYEPQQPSRPDETAMTVDDTVGYLMEAPEQLYQNLDHARPYDAMLVYHKCNELQKRILSANAQNTYPFIRQQMVSIRNFPPKIVMCARKTLTVRGLNAEAYAGALCVLILLANYGNKEVIDAFLQTRSAWLEDVLGPVRSHFSISRLKRVLKMVARVIKETLVHLRVIFVSMTEEFSIPLLLHLQRSAGVDTSPIPDLIIRQKATKWFKQTIAEIHKEASTLLSAVKTSEELAVVPAAVMKETNSGIKMVLANQLEPSKFVLSGILEDLLDHAEYREFSVRAGIDQGRLNLWTILYHDVFVKKIGHLLRSSFVAARRHFEKRLQNYLAQLGKDLGENIKREKVKSSSVRSSVDDGNEENDEQDGDMAYRHGASAVDAAADVIARLESELKVMAGASLVLAASNKESSSYVSGSELQDSLSLECLLLIVSMSNTIRRYLGELQVAHPDQTDIVPLIELLVSQRIQVLAHQALFLTRLACGLADGVRLIPRLLRVTSQKPAQGTIIPPDHIESQFQRILPEGLGSKEDAKVPLADAIKSLQSFGAQDTALAETMRDYDPMDIYLPDYALIVRRSMREDCEGELKRAFISLGHLCANVWAKWAVMGSKLALLETLSSENWTQSDEDWRRTHGAWELCNIGEEDDDEDLEESVWLPAAASSGIAAFMFSICSQLNSAMLYIEAVALEQPSAKDETLVSNNDGSPTGFLVNDEEEIEAFVSRARAHASKAIANSHSFLIEHIVTTVKNDVSSVYLRASEEAVAAFDKKGLTIGSSEHQACLLQMLFDLYLLKFIAGGEDDRPKSISSGKQWLSRQPRYLSDAIDKIQDNIDPVDWELLGHLLQKKANSYRLKTMLLFALLSDGVSAKSSKSVFQETTSADSSRRTKGATVITEKGLVMAETQMLPIAQSSQWFSLLPVATRPRRSSTNATSGGVAGVMSPHTSISEFDTPSTAGGSSNTGSSLHNLFGLSELQERVGNNLPGVFGRQLPKGTSLFSATSWLRRDQG